MCYGCHFGRMKAQKVKPVTGHNYDLLEYIGVDYKNPFNIRTVHGNTGFYLITDHNSGAIWSHPCKSKDEETLFEILDNFLTFTVNRMGKHVSIMHCDADTVELGDKNHEISQ